MGNMGSQQLLRSTRIMRTPKVKRRQTISLRKADAEVGCELGAPVEFMSSLPSQEMAAADAISY
jgi:hypothetical protein